MIFLANMNKALLVVAALLSFSCVSGTGKIVPVVAAPENTERESPKDTGMVEVPALPDKRIVADTPVPDVYKWIDCEPDNGTGFFIRRIFRFLSWQRELPLLLLSIRIYRPLLLEDLRLLSGLFLKKITKK